MKNEIARKTTSLSIIAILVVGGFTFAIPSSTPTAYAQANAMYVSAASDTFENFFVGAQVVEVIINDQQFRGDENNSVSFTPYVTVDDNELPLYQARSGNWYGYFVEAEMAMAAHENGMNFGTYNEETGAYDSSDDRNVLSESTSPDTSKNDGSSNVPIYAFDFIDGTGIDVELENGAQTETVSLEFDTVEDYASLMLDRSVYPLSAHIHITIQDTWLNIDPTSEDWWTFNTYGDTGAFYRLDASEPAENAMAVPTGDLMCDDNCVLLLNPGKQGDNVVTLRDNDDTALHSTGDPANPMSWEVIADDEISGAAIPAGNIPITVYETGANSGVFTNTDSDDESNLVTTSNIDFRGNTAVIDYNDEETDILIGFNFASVEIQLEDETWNSGESVALVVDDMDSNMNSATDEDLLVSDASYKIIPTLKTGNPLVIEDDTTFMINGESVGLVEDQNDGYDKFAARAILDVPMDVNIDTLTIDYNARLVDLRNVAMNEDNVFSYLNYDIQSFGAGVDHVTIMINGCDDVTLDRSDSQSYEALDNAAMRGIHSIACDDNASISLEFTLDGTEVEAGMYAVVADFMSFGYTDDGRQGSERVANQIIRIEAEETDDASGVFEGSLEYVMVNQLNIEDQEIFDDLDTISDAATFIVIEDLTDEDSPRVSYSDLGSDGVVTQVSDQKEAPSHTGVVTFDSIRYKVADTVTITLDDADLNTDADTIDIYTIIQDPDDENYGHIGAEGVADSILHVTFDDQTWAHPECSGLEDQQFTLVETEKSSGVFTGSFQIPEYWCERDDVEETTTGLDIEVNYLDFRDAAGEVIEVGDSAAVGANTGSVALDRTVYPVPFGEPKDFVNTRVFDDIRTLVQQIDHIGDIQDDAESARAELESAEFLAGLSEDLPVNDSWMNADTAEEQVIALIDLLEAEADTLNNELAELNDEPRRAVERQLHDLNTAGQTPDGKSYFSVHTTAFDDERNDLAYIPSGDLTIHIRVTDPDFDVSADGHDSIATAVAGTSHTGPVKISVIRGSDTLVLGYAGGPTETDGSVATGRHNSDDVRQFGPIEEIAPDAGVFEADITIRYTDGPEDGNCPNTVVYPDYFDFGVLGGENYCIMQGDILQVEYTDPIDASGDDNTVTDSATFDLRNAVLQSDKSQYLIGTDMILTLIEPDLDLDNDQAETYTLDLIEWDSDAATISMGPRGGEAAAFDPEPTAFRETGDSTGIFQTIVEIPEELDEDRLERNEAITMEYTDWGPAGADYVGQEDEDVTLDVMTSDFGATIELDQKVYTWTDKVYITIVAPDHNYDSDLVDEIGDSESDPLKVSTRGHELDRYKLVETGTDTGIFTGEVILSGFAPHDANGDGESDDARGFTGAVLGGATKDLGPTNGYLETTNDDGLSVSYEYSEDITIVTSALIRWNIGEVQWLESSYSAAGSGVVRVIDPDMNLNPEAVDNFDVNVWSDADAGGIDLTVTETNEATGIFEGTVSFTTATESSGHRLRVAEGVTVTAEYEDRTLPDPYNMRDDLDITATTLIGTIVPPLERAPASDLRVVDSFGNSLDTVGLGQQVQITADLTNGQDRDQVFAYLVQVQDGNGVVVSLSWITGSLTPGQAFSPSTSWTPDMSGMYTATAFVWESLDNPTALSPPVTTTITVE